MAKAPIPLGQLDHYPRMTSWFRPLLLSKLLLKVIVSDVFGQYADRRLIVAALDTTDEKELFARTQINLQPDEEGAVWVDFVADLGDGFDSTYAVATMLAKPTLTFGANRTRRGQLLIMGGDEVYPVASGQNYHQRLVDPYRWAFPDVATDSDAGVPVSCIPGNHDWYDGLVSFLAIFARRQKLHLGGWRSAQRRSYFALQLTGAWWLWCMDTQLDDDIDQPQRDYFAAIADRMPENSRIILCGPEPGWLYTDKSLSSLGILDFAVGIATGVKRGHSVPLLLSGDTHHYSRYYAARTNTHFITSGGGGAFLHPTHHLKDSIDIRWLGESTRLSLLSEPDGHHGPTLTPSCYPTRKESKRLLIGNLLFWQKNPAFSLLLGFMYWILSMGIIARHHPDVYIIAFLILATGMVGYFGYQEGFGRTKVWVAALIHAAAHFGAIVALALLFEWVNTNLLYLTGFWSWAFALLLEIAPPGLVIGGFIFGLYLLITCRWLDMNHNDAFSAMRLDCYRHFVRLCIKGDEVLIFPIGIDRAPKRQDWRVNTNWSGSSPDEPAYSPDAALSPHLIEKPILLRV